MDITGWKQYENAAIPTVPPHQDPDLEPIKNGSIWNIGNGKVLFARFTTGFDCAEDKPFWHIIKEGPFLMDDLDSSYRTKVRSSFKKCRVERIIPSDFAEEMYIVAVEAQKHYVDALDMLSRESFVAMCNGTKKDVWAAFDNETGTMIGFMWCDNHGDWTETNMAKYHPGYLKLRPSDAIHYAVLSYYLNDLGQKYIYSGTRNISHKTKVQDYKIHNWKFRKAYCNLGLVYRPSVKWLFSLLYCCRKVFLLFDKNKYFHALNSVLLMESLARECRK